MEPIEYRLATLEDLPALIEAGDNLFDYPVKPARAKEFIEDPRHHLMLALDGGLVVGMASGLNYVHPDKDPSLFIDEVSVIEPYWSRKIGRTLVQELIAYAKAKLDCNEAWVATDVSNKAAQRTYLAAGGKEGEEQAVVFVFD